jgi:hypothetical protein
MLREYFRTCYIFFVFLYFSARCLFNNSKLIVQDVAKNGRCEGVAHFDLTSLKRGRTGTLPFPRSNMCQL